MEDSPRFWVPGQPVRKEPDAQFERNPSGAIIIDGKEVAHTRQCCHCGMHFISVRGSGKTRGWCFKCQEILCGKEECLKECNPYKKRLHA